MEIKRKYFARYLHDIAIEQIAEEYRQKGYKVSTESKIGKYQADLIAEKKDEKIVIEVKSGELTRERKERMTDLANYVRSQGNYKFIIAVATTPKDKKLEIEGIEHLLTEEMITNLPSELDELSTHTRIEEVTDIDIDEIEIRGANIFVAGDGVVSVELQYGSDNEQTTGDGQIMDDSFPFEFELTLKYNEKNKLQIDEVDKLDVDTSSFYN
jgi:very-short-patch-repair endonuclease